ncbi:MFS transporter [Streptomyces sp. MP131-18]|uniref:MFS transporter n=1 Tax=Streptomyces sp. MP131-18 TaxID=1857892 RepID=UPI00097C970C|nr:MFS transporter [Streptomyces sp. MP131-18]
METHRRRAAGLLLCVFAAMGYQTGAWAVSVPAIVAELGMTVSQLGLVLALMAAGSIVGSLTLGRLAAWLTVRPVLVAAAAVSGLGYMTLPLLGTTALFAVGATGTGIGLGLFDAAANATGSRQEIRTGRRLLPRLHAAFSFAAAFGVLATYLVEGQQGFGWALSIAGGGCLAGALAALRLPDSRQSDPSGVTTAETHPEWGGLSGRRMAVPVAVVAFTVVCGGFALDSTLEGYSALFIQQLPLQGAGQGALGLIMLYLAATIGRAVSGPALRRMGDWKTLLSGETLALAGVLTLIVDGSSWSIAVGMLMIGVGMSPAIPIAYSLLGRSRSRGRERAIARLTASGYVTFTMAPVLVGVVGRDSLLDAFALLPLLLAGMASTVVWFGYRQRAAPWHGPTVRG